MSSDEEDNTVSESKDKNIEDSDDEVIFEIEKVRDIVNLDELTNDRFDLEIKRQEKYERDSSELIKLFLHENE